MVASKNVWLIRSNYTKPQQGHEKNYIACNLKSTDSLLGKSSAGIFDTLKEQGLRTVNLSIATSVADCFCNAMLQQDLAIVVSRETPKIITVVEIVGEYIFNAEREHTREVRFLHELERNTVPKAFRDLVLRTPRIVARISVDDAIIRPVLENSILARPAALAVKFPLRPDFTIDFDIPRDLTEDEARRLSHFSASLYQQKD